MIALDLLDLLYRPELCYMGSTWVEYLGDEYTRWHLDQLSRHDRRGKRSTRLVPAITFSLYITHAFKDMEDEFANFLRNFRLVAETEITE